VATVVFDDVHIASAVTDRLEPSRIAAVAVNCATAPTAGVVPLTVIAATEEGELGFDSSHAAEKDAIVARSRKNFRTYYVSTEHGECVDVWARERDRIEFPSFLPERLFGCYRRPCADAE